ncbi:lysine exporter LysO family protein [Alistipes sp.]|uniref:lysine exporter LysO family protein n=1 Tax=Alistipes sp. TaxID=1872444 RepID=UPI0025B8BBC3|nr:lysine exporter LysO family protein [Alistipes sp.]MCI7140354.1 lysine exporter LysO family protein [Alistipes sp.]MDY5397603.1 lysine exporter LysO family protein [Alistipes sp.]
MKENLLLFACFFAGILLGNLDAVPQLIITPQLPSLLLMLLVLQVGLGFGADAGLRDTIRSLRPSMVLLPLFTICGTLLFAALGALVPGSRSLTECLAVGSGFGYYSLSSVLIADLYVPHLGPQAAAELAAVALLANVIREMCTLFGLPLFARWCGRLAPISAAGINSMDVCLPGIVRYVADGFRLVPMAILHGLVLEVSVPILIGIFSKL